MIRAGTLRTGTGTAAPARAAAKSIWLISFTDLMCLMLAFFVLAFSMSEPVKERWQALASSFSARQIEGRAGAVFNISMLNTRSPINLDYLGTVLGVQFSRDPDLKGGEAVRQVDRVVIGLPDNLLFEPGQAAFSERGRRALFLLGGVLGQISNRIEVLGHAEAEAVPAEGERDPWELALSRAVAVGTALHQAGYQRHLAVRTAAAARGRPEVGRIHLIDVVVRDLEEGE